jgi:hypothetical protein
VRCPKRAPEEVCFVAALKLGYSNRVIERILEYSTNLDAGILEYDYVVDTGLITDKIDGIAVSKILNTR